MTNRLEVEMMTLLPGCGMACPHSWKYQTTLPLVCRTDSNPKTAAVNSLVLVSPGFRAKYCSNKYWTV